MTRFPENLQLGLVQGLAIGAAFAAVAVVRVFVSWPSAIDQRLPGPIASDLIAGAITGLIVGSLLSFASRSSLAATLVGFVAMLPVTFVGMLTVTPPHEWYKVVPTGFLVAAVFLAGFPGPPVRRDFAGETTIKRRAGAIVVSSGGAVLVLLMLMHLVGWW